MVNKTARLALIIAMVAMSALLVLPAAFAQEPGNLVSVKVATLPTLDGQVDSIWGQAKEIQIPVAGGANTGSTTVSLRSIYMGDMIFFLAQWSDPTESLQRFPWQKQADGTWKQLKPAAAAVNDATTNYEDKLALIWNIGDSITGFNQSGCAVLCHPGEGKPFGNKYTATPGEIGDIWHWKSIRTGTVGQFDDQFVDSTRFDPQSAPEAGRKSDPKTGGGYVDNVAKNGITPKYISDDQPAPPYWIVDSEKKDWQDRFAPGDEVAGMLVAPFTGDRGDLTSNKLTYANGTWTVEWGRKLSTGSNRDVQFTDLSKPYYFGVAVFDNAQVRHATQSGVTALTFDQPLAAAAASPAPAASPAAAVSPAPAALPRTGGLPLEALATAGATLFAIGIGARRLLRRR